MPPTNKIILSTGPLDDALVQDAGRKGIHVDVIPFISAEPIRTIEVQQEIEQAMLQSATVIFTSSNAVEAVAEYMDGQQPDWRVYCIGKATAALVKKYFGDGGIAGTASYGSDLAKKIIKGGNTDEVIFFCGNLRRDELPELLRESDIAVNEIIVYQTLATAQKIKKTYDGIMFFSPSAVNSFFSLNRLPQQTVLFAIGDTTAAALMQYGPATVVTAGQPGKGNLLWRVIGYFREHPFSNTK